MLESVRRTLFFSESIGLLEANPAGWTVEFLDWGKPELQNQSGTAFWPSPAMWEGAVAFLETSEEAPPPSTVARLLRVLAAMEILPKLSAILFGRPGGNILIEHFDQYDQALLQVVCQEQGLTHLPIISQMDFGHTDPIFVLSYGVMAQVDCEKRELRLLEGAVV